MASHTFPCSRSRTSMWDRKALRSSEPLSGMETHSRIGNGQLLGVLPEVRSERAAPDRVNKITWSPEQENPPATQPHKTLPATSASIHFHRPRTHRPRAVPFVHSSAVSHTHRPHMEPHVHAASIHCRIQTGCRLHSRPQTRSRNTTC